jgi:hypothetical protein
VELNFSLTRAVLHDGDGVGDGNGNDVPCG